MTHTPSPCSLGIPEEYALASQQQQLTDIQIRLDRLEQTARIPHRDHTTRNVVLGVLLTAVVTGIGWWGWFVTTNVVAMKQQLADGGNKQLVTELKNPKSSQQLLANLSTVVAQVQTATVEKKPPNAKKVEALSDAVATVLKSQPELASGWNAAAELVSYSTFRPEQPYSASCINAKGATRRITSDAVGSIWQITEWKDCTLYLDAPETLGDIPPSAGIIKSVLDLQNVRIVYRGGKIPDIYQLKLQSCVFDFQLSEPPPIPARRLTVQLLATTTPGSANINMDKA